MFEKSAWTKGPFSILLPAVLVVILSGGLHAQTTTETPRVRNVKLRTPPRDGKLIEPAARIMNARKAAETPVAKVESPAPEPAPAETQTLAEWPLSILYGLMLASGLLLGLIGHLIAVLCFARAPAALEPAPMPIREVVYERVTLPSAVSAAEAAERLKQWDMELGCDAPPSQEEKTQRSEEAMLQELFNENVDLRRHIDELAAA